MKIALQSHGQCLSKRITPRPPISKTHTGTLRIQGFRSNFNFWTLRIILKSKASFSRTCFMLAHHQYSSALTWTPPPPQIMLRQILSSHYSLRDSDQVTTLSVAHCSSAQLPFPISPEASIWAEQVWPLQPWLWPPGAPFALFWPYTQLPGLLLQTPSSWPLALPPLFCPGSDILNIYYFSRFWSWTMWPK